MKEKTAMMIMSATLDKEKPNTVDLRFNVPKAGLEYGCKFVISATAYRRIPLTLPT